MGIWEAHTGQDYTVVMRADQTTDSASIRVGGEGAEALAIRVAALLNAAERIRDVASFDGDGDADRCTAPGGHIWVCRDDDEEISYCENCGADGNG